MLASLPARRSLQTADNISLADCLTVYQTKKGSAGHFPQSLFCIVADLSEAMISREIAI
jgi:hypothetical protein